MGQQQGKDASQPSHMDCTPIFGCFDDEKLGAEVAAAHRDRVASTFVRRCVPKGASIFDYKIGYRDLVIVERGQLRMESVNIDGVKSVIKVVGPNEMLGMVELVEGTFQMDLDGRTGRMPTDVVVTEKGKCYVLVLTIEVYRSQLLANRATDPACELFVNNLIRLTKSKVINWLDKVKLLHSLKARPHCPAGRASFVRAGV